MSGGFDVLGIVPEYGETLLLTRLRTAPGRRLLVEGNGRTDAMGECELRPTIDRGAGDVPAGPDGPRRGDVVTVPATVRRLWRDADAAKRRGDDGRRCDLETIGGKWLPNVPVADLEARRD